MYLRVDDGFCDEPAVLSLALEERWAWLRLLTYCVRHRTCGAIPAGVDEAVPGATPGLLQRFQELHLVEERADGQMAVRDWRRYVPKDPTSAQRMAALRARKREAR